MRGLTKDLKKRFDQHQKGRNRSTRAYRPFKLIYTEEFEKRSEGRMREKYLKSGIGKEFLRRIRDEKGH